MQLLIGLAMLTLVLACIACGLGAMLLDAKDKSRELQLELEELRSLRSDLLIDRATRMERAAGAEEVTNVSRLGLPRAYHPNVLGHREPHEGAVAQAPMRRRQTDVVDQLRSSYA